MYEAGAYAELHKREEALPSWVAGSSIGAINAAVIAGNAPDERIDRLRELWQADPLSSAGLSSRFTSWRWDHLQNWASAIRTRLAGSTGQFRPRVRMPWESFSSMYDLAPLRARLDDLVDFERLNSGAIRLTVATTDLETGELVLFDTGRGDKIGMDHLMASCGFLPEFAPVIIDGRMLGDGGLAANAPIEALQLSEEQGDMTCFVLDVYARDGERPHDLESAMSRKNDLIFSNQIWQRLAAYRREQELRLELSRRSSGQGNNRSTVILYLSYRPRHEEAGAERGFDYSARMLERRWESGAADMLEALTQLDANTMTDSVTLKAIRRSKAA